MPVDERFAAARRAAGLSQEQAASACGISKASYVNRETADSDQFRIFELRGLYKALSNPAKPIFKEAVGDIFLPDTFS